MSDAEYDALVMLPTELDGQPTSRVKGSQVIDCDSCGRQCWIARSSQQAVDAGLVTSKLCVYCMNELVGKESDV